MSQVYGFARQSGGAATIATSARRGTAVTLFLPRTWEARQPPQEQIRRRARDAAAGTVLLVEDNAEVAEVGKAYFEELGYMVKQATSAQAGLDLVESERDIDVVFSDILMPGGMNGLELADAIRRRFPHIAVLLDHRLQFERAGRRAPGFRRAAKALRPRRTRPRVARSTAGGSAGTAAGGGLTPNTIHL